MLIPDKAVVEKLGRTQVYTGASKGKTTACVGLAVRAAGHGLRTYMGQFLKGRPTGEMAAIKAYLKDLIDIEQYGTPEFVGLAASPKESDYELARRGLERAREKMLSGKYHIVILDEINVALSMGLIELSDVERLIREKPERVELILSGRGASPRIIELADLVTEMRVVKHYYDKGVAARKGIEE